MSMENILSRRKFVKGLCASAMVCGTGLYASSDEKMANVKRSGPITLKGKSFELTYAKTPVNFTGSKRMATAINSSVPAPILRFKEGERVKLKVNNKMNETTSIHWHGLILPSSQDGVPGISNGFKGIAPNSSFEYEFDVKQNGTYWYHSHSGYQEQTGSYGAIIIEPKDKYPYSFDREHTIVLSDWSDENPNDIYSNLKKLSHFYNTKERTLLDYFDDISKNGYSNTNSMRAMWNNMRMEDSDISDVTGATYTFLMSGVTPADGWLGLFKNGEKVLLRVINSSAMTIFDFRIPGLKMKVVAADGQYVEPFSVDEFRIAVAETYDILIEPDNDTAYTLFAQAIDRSGYTRGTLTPSVNLKAEVPSMDRRPILGHGDMGMGRMGKNKSGNPFEKAGKAGYGSNKASDFGKITDGAHVDMFSPSAKFQLNDPGIGLRNHKAEHNRKVLTYADIFNLYETEDKREPSREIELHLTGNMARYMWSMNGVKFADAKPLMLKYGERVRITLHNDTMMTHPIHLHGLWSELETGEPNKIPKKHTIIVQPGAKASYLVTADAMGGWAYHCHLLYHMPGMFRHVIVS